MRNTRMKSDIDYGPASASPVHNIFQRTAASTLKRAGSSNLATSISLRSHNSDTTSSLSSSLDLSQSSHQIPIPATNTTEKLKNRDNGFSFGFPPLAATSAAISEALPAPIMTSQSVTGMKSEAGEESIPSFKFGSSDSEPCDRLAFTFGFAVNSSSTDSQTPDFKVGTGKKRDLSFKLIGANGICS